MSKIAKGAAFAIALLCSGVLANAATQHIVGKKLLVKDPTGAETSRLTLILGKEPLTGTGCADTIVGNPVANGATLDVFANGGTNQAQSFSLPAGSSWTAIPGGFKWRDTTNSQPVHLVKIFKTGSSICKFKALLKGADGGTLSVVPPNPGSDGGAVLTIGGGGDTYCIHLGGADGGTTPVNTNKTYKVLNATGEVVCPAAATTTTTSVTTTTSTSHTMTSTTSTTSSTSTSTSSTTSSTVPTACCMFPPGPFFPQFAPACLDDFVGTAALKCALLGGVLGAGTCDPALEVCTLAPPAPHNGCCQCPVPSPPFPNMSFCFDTIFPHVAAKCNPPCVFTPATTCNVVSEICSPSGAFLDETDSIL